MSYIWHLLSDARSEHVQGVAYTAGIGTWVPGVGTWVHGVLSASGSPSTGQDDSSKCCIKIINKYCRYTYQCNVSHIEVEHTCSTHVAYMYHTCSTHVAHMEVEVEVAALGILLD